MIGFHWNFDKKEEAKIVDCNVKIPTEDISYIIIKDKDNKIVNLRSLPNGTKDEIRLSEGKAIIRIGAKTDVVSGTVINYTDMADGGQFVAYYEDGTQQVGIKGDTLTSTATSLVYQLAEPEVIPVRWTGLQAYERGTIYVDTVIPELGFYYDHGLYSHHTEHPIDYVDTLYKVDKETGYKEPLDVSKCEIREDRLSFTHPDLVDGDLCDWDYVPITESTRPEVTFKFPTNLKTSINSLLKSEQINQHEHRIIEQKADDARNKAESVDTALRNITKENVDLGNVDNVKQMPITGGQFEGKVMAYTGDPSGLQIRNIIIIPEDTQQTIIDEVKATMGEFDIIMYYTR